MDIKKYVASSDDRQFVILAPLETILTEEEKGQLYKEAEVEGVKFANEIFGLGSGEVWEDIALMKDISLEEAQEKLFAHGLYLNLGEAMTYSQYHLMILIRMLKKNRSRNLMMREKLLSDRQTAKLSSQ